MIFTMYHGTTIDGARNIFAKGFRRSEDGMLGPGVYVSRDINKARCYPLNCPADQRVILKVKVRVGKVKKIDRQDHPLRLTWHDHGYNTAWVPPNCGMVNSGREEDCVWNPRRVQLIGSVPPCGGPQQAGQVNPYDPLNNTVYTMYHGTSEDGARAILSGGFRQSTDGMLGPGVYVSRDVYKAEAYPRNVPRKKRVVLKLQVNVGRVKKINRQNHPLQKAWHLEGYDTAWVPPNCGMVPSGLEEECVWDPDRVTVIDVVQAPPYFEYSPLAVPRSKYVYANCNFFTEKHPAVIPPIDMIYTMYHGTDIDGARNIFARGFRRSEDGMLGPGVYVSRDINKARCYPVNCPANQRVILKVKVRVGMVKKIDSQDHPLRFTWHEHGYNTAWVPPNCGMVNSGREEDCVWNPSRVQLIGVAEAPPGFFTSFSDSSSEHRYIWKICHVRESTNVNMEYLSGIKKDLKNKISTLLRGETPKNNTVYTMYHGTSVGGARAILSEGFRQSTDGMLGPGVYVSRDIDKAEAYPRNIPHDDRVVLELQVNVGRVKKIDRQNHPLQKAWRFEGYDTAWVPPNCGMVPSGLEEECVWDPDRVTVIAVVQAPPYFEYSPPADVSMPSGARMAPRCFGYAPAAMSMGQWGRSAPYLGYAPAAMSMGQWSRSAPYLGYASPAMSMGQWGSSAPYVGYASPAMSMGQWGRIAPNVGHASPAMSMGQWGSSAPYVGYASPAMSMGQWGRIAPYVGHASPAMSMGQWSSSAPYVGYASPAMSMGQWGRIAP
ncbi:uncharacterized protein LOC144723925 [Lampetra planeri]